MRLLHRLVSRADVRVGPVELELRQQLGGETQTFSSPWVTDDGCSDICTATSSRSAEAWTGFRGSKHAGSDLRVVLKQPLQQADDPSYPGS